MVSTLVRPASPNAMPERPAKRVKFDVSVSLQHSERDSASDRGATPPPAESLFRPHPLQIKPSGNALMNPERVRNARIHGLGAFAVLPDELILDLLTSLDAATLFKLQAVSRAFFVFTRSDTTWKHLYLSASNGELLGWNGDWRRTYWASFWASGQHLNEMYEDNGDSGRCEDMALPADDIGAPDLCSDVLYQPHLCSTPLDATFTKATALNNLKRVNARVLDQGTFAEQYAETSTPVILCSLTDHWPCRDLQGETSWDLDALTERFRGTAFRAEAASVPIEVYSRYCSSVERGSGVVDESPLYLFDAEFVRRTDGDMGKEYNVPPIFGEDLFRVMGQQRPDYRWLIVGPSRAGSSWHKDPNSTSAWNAVITGSKGWILFPPDTPPPGIFVSEDEAEVTAPLSLAEWFANYYDDALKMYGPRARDPTTRGKMIQGVCLAGEVMYIPAGWWHIVVNLESCVAVTQNFVSETELPAVLRFMRDRPEQVSGFKLDISQEEADDDDALAKVDLHARFVEALEREVPDVLARALARMQGESCNGHKSSNALREPAADSRDSLWTSLRVQKLKDEKPTSASAFSFGFGDDLEMDDIPW
ncbi:Clavaminate synthase-like protein [Auriculariales sp. MPI-PUGE-AT-0066]|nr:Clavaminate synthase-like protein [Auriculariales sp. MPI-PUGE-AT-0066]